MENKGILEQGKLFTDKVEFEHLPMVIGSGYEQDVAKLAIEDGVAYHYSIDIQGALEMVVNKNETRQD